MAEFKMPNAAEFAARTLKKAPVMVAESARYDARHHEICISLSNGTRAGIPTRLIPELAEASPADLRKLVIEGRGYGLHIPALDADLSIAQLLADHMGSTIMLKRLKRSQASRLNGKMGGRPKKTEAA
ncbi:DUF2442 domain-containing protein [Asticcacaulis sp. YBE204]|uniref:DUF2442 domain-containing protein n=1 Tax=Asticcacaulis sp. YBE204 TaxID=1282363 RepID=UPI0003C3F150|nr:DUF2442 domain-containing protein [Asticcacaulis sp. YBE204]ESQ81057.1 hypothetical protein AEYBE204_01645 [Asticcacaulis sp. YBE204]